MPVRDHSYYSSSWPRNHGSPPTSLHASASVLKWVPTIKTNMEGDAGGSVSSDFISALLFSSGLGVSAITFAEELIGLMRNAEASLDRNKSKARRQQRYSASISIIIEV
jgi:hypothetical protein